MATIFLALGSNIDDTKKAIESAVGLLSEKISDIQRAPLYRSKAMYHSNQADFTNTVIAGKTDLVPAELLVFVKEAENKGGRIERFRNGPREIDIDILLYDDQIIQTPELSIPHERMHERIFVLKPLVDIAPSVMHPVLHKTIRQLLKELPEDTADELQLLS
jgi:2-amino-4-hydroxy-6-hydroxymethyldihydropteridine diphosphokinase